MYGVCSRPVCLSQSVKVKKTLAYYVTYPFSEHRKYVILQGTGPWGQYYKTFFVLNLRIFIISQRLRPCLQTFDQVGKANQGQTLQLITNIRKLRTKKLNNTGPWLNVTVLEKSSFFRLGLKGERQVQVLRQVGPLPGPKVIKLFTSIIYECL